MKHIAIITGGGSGMGLEAAKLIGKNQKIILAGRTVSKLENALAELTALGIEAEAFPADVSDRAALEALAKYAAEQGKIKTVVHAAGVSPTMADGNKIFQINAAGTIHMTEVFAPLMGENSCILNVASMSAYMVPDDRTPTQLFAAALHSPEAFLAGTEQLLAAVPEAQKSGMAYSISKKFVIWYTKQMAVKYGRSGLRIVSISPGTIMTPMGKQEGEQAASFALNGALGRTGQPEEIAKMMAFMVSDDCSYLTGVDILYDGGSIAALQTKAGT